MTIDWFYSLNSKDSFLVLHGLLHYEEKRVDNERLSKGENTELRLFVIPTKSFFSAQPSIHRHCFSFLVFCFSFQGNPHLPMVSASRLFVNAFVLVRACISNDVQQTEESKMRSILVCACSLLSFLRLD